MENSSKGQASDVLLGLWLSWRELSGHRAVLAFNVAIIALLIAIPVTLDLMGKARRASVQARADYMGPSLSLVPQGMNSYELSTGQMRGRTFSADVPATVANDFAALLKAAEPRLIMQIQVAGKGFTAMGIDFGNVHSFPLTEHSIGQGEVLLGRVAADKLDVIPGDTVVVGTREFVVRGIIATTGAIEDASVFMPLRTLQELAGLPEQINEVRLFTRSSAPLQELKRLLRKNYSHLGVVDSYRGDVVEKDIGNTLGSYHRAVFLAAFALIALCVMISAYINLDGRKAEISTLYTLGARQGIVFAVLSIRTVWLAILGSAAGHLMGLVALLLQQGRAPVLHLLSLQSFVWVTAGTAALGLAVTVPFALYSVFRRDLLADL